MDLTHRFSVPAGIDEAWNAFNDLDALAPCFPGATVSSFDGNAFSGSIKVKLGPIALVYTGSGRYVERDVHARRTVIEAHGDDRRGNGEAIARVTIQLTANGAATTVEVTTALDLTGRPAQFGSGVVSDVSDRLVDQFVDCLSPRFADGLGTAPALEQEVEPDYDHDAEETVELGAAPEEIDGITLGADDTPTQTRPAAASWSPPKVAPTPTYTPPTDVSQTDFNALATVVPVVLKRFWPVLTALAVLGFIASKIIGRKR